MTLSAPARPPCASLAMERRTDPAGSTKPSKCSPTKLARRVAPHGAAAGRTERSGVGSRCRRSVRRQVVGRPGGRRHQARTPRRRRDDTRRFGARVHAPEHQQTLGRRRPRHQRRGAALALDSQGVPTSFWSRSRTPRSNDRPHLRRDRRTARRPRRGELQRHSAAPALTPTGRARRSSPSPRRES